MMTTRFGRWALASILASALGVSACGGESTGTPEFFPVGDEAKADGFGRREDGPKARYVGQSEFVSAAPFYRIWGPWIRAAAEREEADKATTERQVVESDVYRHDGNYLYVLNAYRGLQIIDVSSPDRPTRLSRVDIFGRPVEMYVKGNRAYVLISEYFTYEQERALRKSRLLTVDISSRTRPRIIGALDASGDFRDSRMVGDVIYVVSTEYGRLDPQSGKEIPETTHVLSVNVSTSRPYEVQRVSFQGTSYQIHASSDYLFLAQYGYPNTKIVALGISDPRGRIVRGGEFEVPGYLQDRFQMNYARGILRVVTHHWENSGTIFVKTLGVSRAANLREVGSLELPGVGQLLATKFDGNKAYLVHIVRIDPLDVIDLSDPAKPTRLSSLEIPGWLEHLEIRQDRVLGIGVDNTSGQNKLAVALYDVADPTNTRELARAVIDQQWAWTPGFGDDRAFRMLDEQGLLLVPFSAWSGSDSLQAVQLVDFDLAAGTLATRGRIEQAGTVQRAFPLASRVGAFTELELRVANIDNRDAPYLTASLELARNVRSFLVLSPAALQLVGNWNEYPELRAFPVGKPDGEKTEMLSSVTLPKETEKIYASGNLAVAMTRAWNDQGKQVITLVAHDFSRPSAPKARGKISLEVEGYGGYVGPWYRRAGLANVVQLRPELFAVANVTGEGQVFHIVSFARPDEPRVVFQRTLARKGQFIDMRELRGALYVTHFEEIPSDEPKPEPDPLLPEPVAIEGTPVAEARMIRPPVPTASWGKYFVTRLTITSRGIVASPPVNIPGRFVDVDSRGNLITLDQRWAKDDGEPHQHKHLTKLRVSFPGGRAILRDLLNVSDGVQDVIVRDGSAFFTSYESSWTGPVVLPSEGDALPPQPEEAKWELHVVDVTRARLREASHTVLQRDGAGALLDVRSFAGQRFAFLTLGMGGLAVYDVTDSEEPSMVASIPASAWYSEVLVDERSAVAYTWSGLYGVRSIELPVWFRF
ncbi:MAG: beta-propeller domain-containing protein [Deltaproteobacteria bacterium]|nr:beta-propeller domain-containing protein [Deltaproteobacteria bacterium]